jgi:hypothetical protein
MKSGPGELRNMVTYTNPERNNKEIQRQKHRDRRVGGSGKNGTKRKSKKGREKID